MSSANIPFHSYKFYKTRFDETLWTIRSRKEAEVLCVISSTDAEDKGFLQKVMAAVPLNESQYTVLEIPKEAILPLSEKIGLHQWSHIFCFGVPLSSLSIHIAEILYQPILIKNTKIVPLPTLSVIQMEHDDKRKLWGLIKTEFLHE